MNKSSPLEYKHTSQRNFVNTNWTKSKTCLYLVFCLCQDHQWQMVTYLCLLWFLQIPATHIECNIKDGVLQHLVHLTKVKKRNWIHNQSADSTWTGFLMVFNYYSWYCVNANQLLTPTFYYMHDCQDSLIQCFTWRIFVSIPIQFQHTSAQSISTLSALILARDSETGWDSG